MSLTLSSDLPGTFLYMSLFNPYNSPSRWVIMLIGQIITPKYRDFLIRFSMSHSEEVVNLAVFFSWGDFCHRTFGKV